MALTTDSLLEHSNLAPILRQLARSFVSLHAEHTRVSTVYATQQRWLMAHLAMSIYFRARTGDAAGLTSAEFLKSAADANIASRNTAYAFLQEMLKYGYVRQVPVKDKRFRPMELSEFSVGMVDIWIALHLGTLDAFDAGDRCTRYHADPQRVERLQPLIADAMIAHSPAMSQQPTFSLFTWLNQGGLVMDTMIAGLEEGSENPHRIHTSIHSSQEIAERLGISRTHLGRKMKEAEGKGSIGWTGARGRSVLWVSPEFRREYHSYQATKLALIDSCFEATLV